MTPLTPTRAPDTYEALERYWTETLPPFVPTAGVPPDFARRAATSPALQRLDLGLPRDLAVRALDAMAGSPVLLLAHLVAATAILLRHHNPGDAISVLTPTARRADEEPSTNRWLVVKNAIDPQATAAALVEQVRGNLAAAFAHQEFPFARVLELVGVTWPSRRAPLSDVAVLVEEVSRTDVLDDVCCDLAIAGATSSDAVRLSLTYRSDLFAAGTAVAFGERLGRVLQSIVEAPERRVGEIRLLRADEEAALVSRWRRRDEQLLPGRRVDALIAAVVAERRDEPAFFCGSEVLTYGDLMTRARALAALLQRRGVAPGDRVAIALDRGVHLPVAFLGTWLVGAALIPIDPRHPVARVQRVLDRVTPSAILAEPRLRAAHEIYAQALEWEPAAAPPPAGPTPIDGDDRSCAYVMFTSGSTGTPSGAAISHRSLVNYLLWARHRYLDGERPTFALYSSIAFDLTLTSIVLPLISGCATVIFPFEDTVDMEAVFADPRVEIVKATPSHLKQLRLGNLPPTRVRRVIVGGEAFDCALATALQEALGQEAAIFNEYGPTEATIGCTVHRFGEADRSAGSVPIGRPIWNASVYVLDDERRPVPPHVAGQLWIAGTPLADGYVDDAVRTGERFVDDSIAGSGRMYATGDRARVNADGALCYLGRVDDQVKVNGARIELAEVHAALAEVPRVRDAVVRLRHDERGQPVLVAYYVARQAIDASLLRAALAERLPAEMMPHLFARVPRLPLTLNGKVDVDRLPSLDAVRRDAPPQYAPPQSDTEQIVAAVWCEVLGITAIGIHSNFFELGGHSLLASQVAWRISERLGVDVPLRLLFDAPTIARLSARLDHGAGKEVTSV